MSSLVIKHGEVIPQDTRSLISSRYHTITKAINREFWNSISETAHSLYVGSYGRGTAIDTSDIDILLEIPKSEYQRYDVIKGNGQSRLLQAVRSAILTSYPRTDIRADGQVVKVQFSDGMKMELLPAFPKQYSWESNEYTYPDSNNGGKWMSTNPKAEQEAMKKKNASSNGLLFDTCKHIRYIRDNYFSSYHLSGIVIDSFVYQAIQSWRWTPPGESSSSVSGTYEQVLLDYYNNNLRYNYSLQTPGSGQTISITNSKECLGKVLNYMV